MAALTILMGAILLYATGPADAVVLGTSSSLGGYTVRLVGPFNCTGVAIGRQHVATAAHCANRRMRIMGGGGSIGIAGVSRSAVLDDGRQVSVSGDAAILKLAAPLPSGISAAPIGNGNDNGNGDRFTIAGYGTTDERARGAFGALHEASLVAAPGRQLVDPNRTGTISASACFGDSGGPVMRGGMLVGIITRANHPNKPIACGFYTRWAPIAVRGTAVTVVAAADVNERYAEPAPAKRQLPSGRKKTRAYAARTETRELSLFARWFAPQAETRKTLRRRSAQR